MLDYDSLRKAEKEGTISDQRIITHRTTVQNLRNMGFKVSVEHLRFIDEDHLNRFMGEGVLDEDAQKLHYEPIHQAEFKKLGIHPYPRGGMTFVNVTSPEGQTYMTYACCCPRDNYSKKLGVRIALGRFAKRWNDFFDDGSTFRS